MTEVLGSEIVPIEALREDKVVVVNPIAGKPFNFAGKDLLPFKKYLVDKDEGLSVCLRCDLAIALREEQRQIEKSLWQRYSMSIDPALKDKAHRYCDPQGNPLSPVIKYPHLVLYDTERGRKIVTAALEEAKANGFEVTKKQKQTEQVLPKTELDDEEEDPGAFKQELRVPNPNWPVKQKVAYIEALSGKKPAYSYWRQKKKMNELCVAAFEAKKAELTDAGVPFTEV